MTILARAIQSVERLHPVQVQGSAAAVRGLLLRVHDLPLPIGSIVRIEGRLPGHAPARGEVVGFDGSVSLVMLYAGIERLEPGAVVIGEQADASIQAGPSLLGRVIDGLGRPIDERGATLDTAPQPLHADPVNALRRGLIGDPLPTGIRAIDGVLTVGRGQRMGIFAGPGVGKSSLLAAIARNTAADVNVIALVGERGREVREFVEHTLGTDGLARSVVVVSTGDESPLLRVRAALAACAIAEHFREMGKHVMLMMDSITRLAQAQRQIGLAVGEPPATKGYTPSVFSLMSRLLERAGLGDSGGSITGIYTILVEGDDLTEPVSDAARGILDGHIALSRRLAAAGHYPAIDVLDSISRVADKVCDPHHIQARRTLLATIASYRDAEEIIRIGAYVRGSNPEVDTYLALEDRILGFLRQSLSETAEYPRTCRGLLELAAAIEATRTAATKSARTRAA